jgi:hypothetical protein
MWCWRRVEKISLSDRVRNEEALNRVKEERNIHTAKRRKGDSIGHILYRNCLINHVIKGKLEGKIYVRGRRGRRHKQLLDDLEETRSYCNLKEETVANCVENWLWKRLWTFHKTDFGVND